MITVSDLLLGARTVSAPSQVRVAINSTLTGIVVRIGSGPSVNDPLDQLNYKLAYDTLAEALEALPMQIASYVSSIAGTQLS